MRYSHPTDTITPRQLVALGVVGLLSPLVRRFPQALAAAGRNGWLAAPLAALPLLLWPLLYRALLRRRGGETAKPADLRAALRSGLGPVLFYLYPIWMICYAGFLLRAGAVRLLSTVYPAAGPAVFVLGMALLCALAASGSLRALARSAMLLRPLLLAVIGLVLALSADSLDPGLLFPVTGTGILEAAPAAAELANALGAAFPLAFLCAKSDALPSNWQLFGWGGALLGLCLAAAVCCFAMFGPALTARMHYPFFMLARDVTVLGAVERVEPLVAALWIASDFTMIGVLLWMSARLILPKGLDAPKAQTRRSAPAAALAAAVIALLLPGELLVWNALSERIVPLCSAAFSLLLPVLALLKNSVNSEK